MKDKETPLPDDWYKETNQAPIIVRNGVIDCYGSLPRTIRYYTKPPRIKTKSSNIPLENWGLLDLATQIMIVLAMSNHGFDMQTESDFAQAIVQLIK